MIQMKLHMQRWRKHFSVYFKLYPTDRRPIPRDDWFFLRIE